MCVDVCLRCSHLPRGLFLVVGALSLSSFVQPLTHSCTDTLIHMQPQPQAKQWAMFCRWVVRGKSYCKEMNVQIRNRRVSDSSPTLSRTAKKERLVLTKHVLIMLAPVAEQNENWSNKGQDGTEWISIYTATPNMKTKVGNISKLSIDVCLCNQFVKKKKRK